ncbi:MAG: patatin-like phospholipase family protein [Pseudomonadota bacterium]|nr:patatin-like phospholipase family protein [Pseudomonadota bacterium]
MTYALSPPERYQPPQKKSLSLALQGGGSHGAFTWGVLDRLLEDQRIEIEAFVGTSSGAINATVAAYGLEVADAHTARQLLSEFWHSLAQLGKMSPLQPSWLDQLFSRGNMDYSPTWVLYDYFCRLFSPYQLNPINLNFIKKILSGIVDFSYLHQAKKVKLFVCATNVLNARLKIFEQQEVTPEAVMASACLPFLFQAVEIDGHHYWDGGYLGNPPIFPLIYKTQSPDILVVQVNPINITEVPQSAQAILDRINTLSFNSSLMREMRVIHFISSLITQEHLDEHKYKYPYIHTIDAEAELAEFSFSSKMNVDVNFLEYLFEMGRHKADTFINTHFDKIGNESSTDIMAKFY